MDEGTSEMLKKVTFVLVVLVIIIYLFIDVSGNVKETNIVSGTKERLDIIVSDQVPIGCFVPPDGGSAYSEIKADDALKKICLGYTDPIAWGVIEDGLIPKDMLAQSINGIKLDGYCSDTERDTCLGLNEKVTDFEKTAEGKFSEENIADRRNIDFGIADDLTLGSGIGSSQYSIQGSVPSVFVVQPGQAAKLSVYAGARTTGNKTIEKISFGVYKGTAGINENELTEPVGEHKSCYCDAVFEDCFKTWESTEKCGCSENILYLEEPSLELCLNYAELKKGSAKDFADGCNVGEYINCILSGKSSCEKDFPDFGGVKNIDVDEPCKTVKDGWKEGCNRYFLFEKSVFSIQPPNYTIVKLGDFEVKESAISACKGSVDQSLSDKDREDFISGCEKGNSDKSCTGLSGKSLEGCNKFYDYSNGKLEISTYRGLAYVSAKVSVAEPSPGVSCYSQEIFNDYDNCCLESCKSKSGDQPGDKSRIDCAKGCTITDPSLAKCRSESTTAPESSAANAVAQAVTGTETQTKCAEKYCCSTTKTLEGTTGSEKYLLCKNFCSSHDAYYGDENAESQKNCTEGCDWAARMENKFDFSKISSIDLVFIADTSQSMVGEWSNLCDEISKIAENSKTGDYKITSTIYSLRQGKKAIGVDIDPSCNDVPLDCTKINSEAAYSLDCDDPVKGPDCYRESWGPAAEWAVKKHPWQEGSLKIIFVISDEGPYCGGDENVASNHGCNDGCFNTQEDIDSISRAVEAAKKNDVIIYGLWGDFNMLKYKDDQPAAEELFWGISKPTGGKAMLFSSGADISGVLDNIIGRGEAFNKGYEKYASFSIKDNLVPQDKGYYFRQAYEEVYSNLIYIVDWNKASGSFEWRYPAEGNDWYSINLNNNPDSPEKIRSKPLNVIFNENLKTIISK